MRLYWNERFPDLLYCLHEGMVYKLSQEADAFVPDLGEWTWTKTVWNVVHGKIECRDFRYLGSINPLGKTPRTKLSLMDRIKQYRVDHDCSLKEALDACR